MRILGKIFKRHKETCIMCGDVNSKGVHIHNRYFCSEDCFQQYVKELPLEKLIAREREDLGAGSYALLRK